MPSRAVAGSSVVAVALIAVACARVPFGERCQRPSNAAGVVDGPCMVFDKTKIDFGVVTDEAPLVARFRFTNVGKKTLILNRPRLSRGGLDPAVYGVDERDAELHTR